MLPLIFSPLELFRNSNLFLSNLFLGLNALITLSLRRREEKKEKKKRRRERRGLMITSVEQTGQRDAYGLSETSVTVFVRHPKVKGIESRPAANMRFTKKKKFQQIRT